LKNFSVICAACGVFLVGYTFSVTYLNRSSEVHQPMKIKPIAIPTTSLPARRALPAGSERPATRLPLPTARSPEAVAPSVSSGANRITPSVSISEVPQTPESPNPVPQPETSGFTAESNQNGRNAPSRVTNSTSTRRALPVRPATPNAGTQLLQSRSGQGLLDQRRGAAENSRPDSSENPDSPPVYGSGPR